MSSPKTPRRVSRKNPFPVLLNHRLDRKLLAYTAAASTAGIGMMALGQPAQAEIVYTPTHQTVSAGGSVILDLDNDGITDFIINSNRGACSTGPDCESQRLTVIPMQRNRVLVTYGGMAFAQRLPAHDKIGAPDNFRNLFGYAKMDHCKATRTSYYVSGSWPGANQQYLGLEFSIRGKIHYGWARLSVSVNGRQCNAIAVLTGYAYETEPNRPIVTGKTSGEDEAAAAERPQGTLGALALGSAGAVAWRRDEEESLKGEAVASNP
jgi:hypothetical protein